MNAATPARRVERILIAVDGSEPSQRAVEHVLKRVREGASVEVALVNVQPPILSGDVRRFVTQAMIDHYHRTEGETALRRARAALDEAGVGHEDRILVGHPGQTIAAAAADGRYDRIVIGRRGLGPLADLVLGSVATQVIHASSVPVTLVQ